MAIHLAVFAFGGLLMLVAVLGGGFEIRELKVPQVGRASRLAACACGMLFTFIGILLDRPAAATLAAASQTQKIEAAAPAPAPQIILVSASGQFEMKDRIGNAAPQPQETRASSAESQQKEPETASPAALAAPPEAAKRGPIKRARRWLSRVKG